MARSHAYRLRQVVCPKCKIRPPGPSQNAWCKECLKEYRDANPEQFRGYRIKYRFSLTLEQVEAKLKEQGGRCAICGTDQPGGRTNQWHIDHNHRTGRFRGLLCNSCNLLLGHAKDRIDVLRSAMGYLRKEGKA